MYQRLTDTNSCRYNKQNDACWGKKGNIKCSNGKIQQNYSGRGTEDLLRKSNFITMHNSKQKPKLKIVFICCYLKV